VPAVDPPLGFPSPQQQNEYIDSAVAVPPPPTPIVVKFQYTNLDPITAQKRATQALRTADQIKGLTLENLTIRNRRMVDLSNRITKMSVSLSSMLQSQVTVELDDPDFTLLSSKVFNGQPSMNYLGLQLELAGVATLARGRGALRLSARSAKTQMLKRRRGPLTIIGDERSFIGYECDQVQQPFVTVPGGIDEGLISTNSRVSRDWKPYTQYQAVTDTDEIPSSWTTFKRLAQQRGWWLFEANNILYFAPPTWLFVNSTIVRVRYSPNAKTAAAKGWTTSSVDTSVWGVVVDTTTGGQYWKTLTASGNFDPGIIECLDVPVFDHSSDRVETTVSFKVAAGNEQHFLPGKVIDMHGVPEFDGLYLCTGVDYDVDGNDVTVTGQTPVDPQPQGQSTFGGFSRASDNPALPGLDLTGSGSADVGLPVCGITMASFLKGVRITESGKPNGNYTAKPPFPGGPSGAYQYIYTTWLVVTPAAVAQKYQYAYLAPPGIQDQAAEGEITAMLKAHGNDWGKVAAHHLYPPTCDQPHLWKYRPYMEPGGKPPSGYNPQSNPPVIDYVRKVLLNAGGVMCATEKFGGDTKLATDFVTLALSQVGKPYEETTRIDYLHTANPAVLDCSALVQWAAAGVGVTLPRNSAAQWKVCGAKFPISVSTALKVRGALLWIDSPGSPGGQHVAISMGDGKHELAAHTSHAPLDQQINVRATDPAAWSRAALIPGMTYPQGVF
jgi:cell wall-associated NlpC family hydrolase